MVKWTVIICQVTFSKLTLMSDNQNAEEDGGAGATPEPVSLLEVDKEWAGLTVRSWQGVGCW